MLRGLTVEESRGVREFLREAGYTTKALIACFGHIDNPKVHLVKLALVGKTLEPSCLHTLFRWFWVGVAVADAEARAWIPGGILELFLKCGMLAPGEGVLRSTVRISLFNDLVILSDQIAAGHGAAGADTVLWPNPTSMVCHQLSMQAPVERTLDLGTGNGILAIAAAAHSGHVVATDLNARARQFCELNAALNGVGNVEFREGSAFEPVQGEKFDLILANPPFFVTPSVRRVYSDNSMELDGFCRMLVRQAPEHLNENGYCQMLVEWVQLKGQPWRERLGEWFADLGCDAWAMVTYVQSGLDYALLRMQEDRDELTDPAAQEALVDSWQQYLASHEVESIYGGMIVLRRRQGKNWVRMEELASLPTRPLGEFLRGIFETRDYLDSHSDEQLLEARPVLPRSAHLEKEFAMSAEGWRLSGIELRLGQGLPYSLALQPQVADFVGLCTGKHTLGELADGLASALSVDPVMVRRECCGIVRRLADRGMLEI
jgi:methylase of polypeptide subunit release factors